MPRTLAIGDIHGSYTALITLAARVPFADDDLIITLGDYVDRGPRSREVLDWLIQRNATGRLIALMGNHECIMLQAERDSVAMKGWFNTYVGGRATVDSYAPANGERPGRLTDVPEAHWHFIKQQTRRHHETETHLFVHANANYLLPLEAQNDEILFWQHLNSDAQKAHISGKTIICGHTAQRSGEILDLGHTICIDTAAAGEGWLTCLDPDTGQYWQANERGEFRKGELADKCRVTNGE